MMEEKKCTVTTVCRENTIETVIESKAPQLKELCDNLRKAKESKRERLRKMDSCPIKITV